MVIDKIAREANTTFKPPKAGLRWKRRQSGAPRTYDVAEAGYRGRPVVLVKPQTFMNKSGLAVKSAIRRYRVDFRDVLIIYDDINLPLGAVRLRESGGAGGHNGLEDIIQVLNSENLPRMRVGIGNNFPRGQQTTYVLSPFDTSEYPLVGEILQFARKAALTFVRDGIVSAMNRYNRTQLFSNESNG
jgi:PTH1 family peptidyl-tRNA hydrolase